MKPFFTLLSIAFLVYFFTAFEFYDAILATLASGVLMYLLENRVTYYLTLLQYADRYENIYIISNHPKIKGHKHSEEEVDFKGIPFELIVCVEHRLVINEIAYQTRLLVESKNTHFNDPDLTEEQRLQIKPIIFQDAEFINETWKQFQKRVKHEIHADRLQRHAMLKQSSPIWYHKHANFQHGIQLK